MRKTGKEIAELILKDFDGKEMANEMSTFVNSFSIDKKGFLEGVSENTDALFDIIFLWLIKLRFLKKINYYDLRNEYSVKTGAKLAELFKEEVEAIERLYQYNGSLDYEDYESGMYWNELSDKEKEDSEYKEIEIETEIMFVEAMSREHRTLQQSFSGLIFELLTLFPEFSQRLEELDDNFFKAPLI